MSIGSVLKPTKWKIISAFVFSLALIALFLSAPYFGMHNFFLSLKSSFKVLSIIASLLFGMIIYYPLICGLAFFLGLGKKGKKKIKKKKPKRGDFIAAILFIIIFNPITLGFIYSGIVSISNQNKEPCGMQIMEFTDVTPAKDAGMKIGEIILEVDGNEIGNADSFIHALAMKKPGDDVSIETSAGNYTIKLAAKPDNPEAAFLGVKVVEKYCAK